jgi:hypothetical protein
LGYRVKAVRRRCLRVRVRVGVRRVRVRGRVRTVEKDCRCLRAAA